MQCKQARANSKLSRTHWWSHTDRMKGWVRSPSQARCRGTATSAHSAALLPAAGSELVHTHTTVPVCVQENGEGEIGSRRSVLPAEEVKQTVRTVKSACTLLPLPVAGHMPPPTGAFKQSNAPKATMTNKARHLFNKPHASSLCGTSSTKSGPSNSWQRPNGTQRRAQGKTQPR